MDKLLAILKSGISLLTIFFLAVIAFFIIIDWPWDWRSGLWTWLGQTSAGAEETNSTTLRNFGFIIAGLLAVVFAYWRSVVADRQAKASQQQAEIAQRGLLNERYQKGVELLANEVLAVRLGGIYALLQLSQEHPEQYHVQTMQVLCALVRNPNRGRTTKPSRTGDYPDVSEDVRSVLEAIRTRTSFQVELERRAGFRLNLEGAYLRFVDLECSDLRHADLSGSDLYGAQLFGSQMDGTDLSYSFLAKTQFSAGGRCPATGLTQAQLENAYTIPGHDPELRGVLDVASGKQLKWNGKVPSGELLIRTFPI